MHFRAAAAERILVKDGAYGTLIQAERLKEADYRGELGAQPRPAGQQRPAQPHPARRRPEDRAAASSTSGADILATNTFNANRISQADYGAESLVARHQPRRGADHPRGRRRSERDGRQRWVAGAIGPTNKTLSLSPDVNDPGYREVDFDEVKAVYREQIDALVEGGIDFVLIETVFDTLNCKAAIMAALEAEQALGRELPIMISMTLTDLRGRNLSRPHGRGLLGQRPPCPAADHRPQLLVRRGAAAAASRRAGAAGRNAGHGLSQRRPAQRAWLL